MKARRFRLGLGESIALASWLVVIGVVSAAAVNGWVIALVPGLTYVLASGAAYLVYRQNIRERRSVATRIELGIRHDEHLAAVKGNTYGTLAKGGVFHVVGVQGVCPFGLRMGDLVKMDATGSFTPALCPHTESALRLAAATAQESRIRQWCCPIYDHLLVFQLDSKLG